MLKKDSSGGRKAEATTATITPPANPQKRAKEVCCKSCNCSLKAAMVNIATMFTKLIINPDLNMEERSLY